MSPLHLAFARPLCLLERPTGAIHCFRNRKTFQRLLVLFKGFLLRLWKSFFCLSAWRSSIIPHPRLLVNTFCQIFSFFFACTPKQQQAAGKTAPQLHCSCGGKSGRVLSRNYSGFQDLRRVSQTAAASMGSIPIRPMGAGPNTL